MTTFGILANSSSLIQLEQYDDYASEISGRVQFFNRNELRKISHLGNGCFSNVDCVVTKSRDHFALKHLDPTRISRSDEFVIAASDLAREAKILSKLEHSNVIRLRGVSDSTLSQSWEDEHGYFLLMDVLHGTLKDRLQGWRKGKKKSFLSFAKRGSRAQIDEMMGRFETVALGIVKGMAYIHSQNIIIQDLKPANIGFGEDGEVRLFDFGMAREMDCEMNANDLMCGTPRYMAPEIWASGTPTKKSDVFSFGLVLYEIASLKVPFSKETSIDRIKTIVTSGKRPNAKDISDHGTRELVAECWAPEQDDRPEFDAIKNRLMDILMADAMSESTSSKIRIFDRRDNTWTKTTSTGSVGSVDRAFMDSRHSVFSA